MIKNCPLVHKYIHNRDISDNTLLFSVLTNESNRGNGFPRWRSWIIEIIKWEGVGYDGNLEAYYAEMLNDEEALVEGLQRFSSEEAVKMYYFGKNNYSDSAKLQIVYDWIDNNRIKLYEVINTIVMDNKSWFYEECA